MPKTSELFIKWLRDLTAERGEKAEFCRKTGIGRAVVDKWLSGVTAPTMDTLDRISEGTGVPVWEMIRPEGAIPAPTPPPSPTSEQVLEIVRDALFASKKAPAEKPIETGYPGAKLTISPAGRNFAEPAGVSFDPADIPLLIEILNAPDTAETEPGLRLAGHYLRTALAGKKKVTKATG